MIIKKRQFIIISALVSILIVFLTGCGVKENKNVKPTDSKVKPAEVKSESQGLIKNGDFEDVKDSSWVSRGFAQVTYTTDEFHGGKHSLKTTGRTNTWEGPMINLAYSLTKGDTYHFAVWLKYNDGPANKKFNLQFENITSSAKTSYEAVGSVMAAKGKWTLLEGDYAIPNDPNLTRYSLYIEPDSQGTMDFYIDDVTVTKTKALDVQRDIPSLREVLKDYFPIGAATGPKYIDKTNLNSELIKYQYGVLVAGNEMKPASLQPSKGNFNWSEADKFVDFAQANNMLLRGHTLVWHSQVPNWFFTNPEDSTKPATSEQLLNTLKNHISTVVGRYKGKVYCWDVVNEVLSDSNGLRSDKENSKWKSIIGDIDGDGYDSDYIELAFKYAHEADPNAKLIINDYGLEGSTRKRDEMYNLVKRMLEKGIPVDGIGLQMHISIYSPSAQEIKACIDKLSSLKSIKPGFTIQVTEMDMSVYKWQETQKTITDDILMQQAKKYGEIFDVFKDEAKQGNLSMVVMWGSADNDSWLDDFPIKGRGDAGLLFDRKRQAKPAYWAIVDPSKLQ